MKRVVRYAADMSNVLGNYYVPDHDLEPPEYSDSEYEEDEGKIQLDFNDVEVVVNPDMTWDYVDDTYSWAAGPRSGGWWYLDLSSHSYDISIDRSSVVEYIDSIIEPMMPSEPGTYYLSGEAELWFDVTLEMYDDEVFDKEYDFNYQESSVDNFKASKIQGR